ncbi:DNA-formamidopyrimidine glycosylase [Pullulanibacillus sp. KACC 23026]|uniref:DNA-formamidopyrimidine glycosylase n=1 Tax=Pullulanibacillus sp. KACC 23026 TaxID=3028315 RepID=UPI0023B0E4C3|nr:DNA-formamidopyrimidine glycosylase [Pullulanibacillus sp. KACC 23026]WEG13911.1 DNA-formamidopyrimidine glycosylase [Pullulanibacillus sp. KACC 23026]
MPELPEVETVKETLKQLVLGKTIRDVVIFWPKLIKEPPDSHEFAERLKGQTIHNIRRRGKFLCLDLDEEVLVSHLRMEGKYVYFNHRADVTKDAHTHVIFTFTDGSELHYKDVRKFGTMHVFPKGEEERRLPLVQLGPEPLEERFTAALLKQRLKNTTRAIKLALLDQTVVVGLGNIYVDEALFRARIHPETPTDQVSQAKLNQLVPAIKETLGEAVEMGGSTVRTYRNGQGRMGMFQQKLAVYGREGEPCVECGTPIKKIKLGGRGTHFCPNCQKRRKRRA